MPTVTVRVDDETKDQMEEYPEINWSAVLRERISEVLEKQEDRDLAQAVLLSERISQSIDPDDAADWDSTAEIRKWRDERNGRR